MLGLGSVLTFSVFITAISVLHRPELGRPRDFAHLGGIAAARKLDYDEKPLLPDYIDEKDEMRIIESGRIDARHTAAATVDYKGGWGDSGAKKQEPGAMKPGAPLKRRPWKKTLGRHGQKKHFRRTTQQHEDE